MKKEDEKLRELANIEASIVALTVFLAMFVISSLPTLTNDLIGYEKTLFSVPGVSTNFPTVPALNPSLSQSIMLWSSIGIFIMIGIIYAVFAKSDPNVVRSFIDSETGSFIFDSYIFIAGCLFFFGLLYGAMIGPNTAINLSFLNVLSIFLLMFIIKETSHSTSMSSKKEKTKQSTTKSETKS